MTQQNVHKIANKMGIKWDCFMRKIRNDKK